MLSWKNFPAGSPALPLISLCILAGLVWKPASFCCIGNANATERSAGRDKSNDKRILIAGKSEVVLLERCVMYCKYFPVVSFQLNTLVRDVIYDVYHTERS